MLLSMAHECLLHNSVITWRTAATLEGTGAQSARTDVIPAAQTERPARYPGGCLQPVVMRSELRSPLIHLGMMDDPATGRLSSLVEILFVVRLVCRVRDAGLALLALEPLALGLVGTDPGVLTFCRVPRGMPRAHDAALVPGPLCDVQGAHSLGP